jgi:hypothetical protein
MQPSMDACAWIHQAQDRLWRPYVLRTPDVAMRTSLPHVYYPWQVFQRWQLRSLEGPLHQGSATPRCQQDQLEVFPRQAATVSQARWRYCNNFRGGATDRNLSLEDYRRLIHYHFKTSFKPGRKCPPRRGSADPARTSTEGAAPTTPPGGVIDRMRQGGGVIDRMRQGSIIGSVGPLHWPGRQRSHASAGQPDLPEGENQLGPTTSHHGQSRRRSFLRTRRTNQMGSTNSLRLRRRHHRLPGIHRRRHSDRRAAILRGSGPVSGPVAGRA